MRALFDAVVSLPRFIACPATAKRFFMVWCEPSWTPTNATSCFAFADDYAFGVLQSTIHTGWARDQSTTLETRPRYTTLSFASFPWPELNTEHHKTIGDVAQRLHARRSEICVERQIGLTKLYNDVDDGAHRDLADLHVALDEAVAAAYGWPASAAHDLLESNRLLLGLNQRIAAGEVEYDPFLAHGS